MTRAAIRLTVFSQGGNFENIWGFSTDDFLSPGVTYVKTAGSNNGDSEYEDFIPCFVRGTLIRMADGGTCPVEDIAEGDLVWTKSSPSARVRWTGSSTVAATGNLAPVRLAKGVLGNTDALLVSPQHRLLLGGAGAQLLFSTEEVLVPAIHLMGLDGVSRQEGGEVAYFHLMFDAHEIVEANGVLTESFFPGDMGLRALGQATRNELALLFPDLGDGAHLTAAPCLKGRDATVMRDYLMQ